MKYFSKARAAVCFSGVLALVCASAGYAGIAQPGTANTTGKVPEWPFLTGAPSMPQLQQMLQMIMQMIQQAMQQQSQGGSGSGAAGTPVPGTPSYYQTPQYVTDANGNQVNCAVSLAMVCPLYKTGLDDGKALANLKAEYQYDLNYVSGYRDGVASRQAPR